MIFERRRRRLTARVEVLDVLTLVDGVVQLFDQLRRAMPNYSAALAY